MAYFDRATIKVPRGEVMAGYVSPIRSLDFEEIQVQVQLGELTPENIVPHQEQETQRIREKVRDRPAGPMRKAVVIVDASCNMIPTPQVRKAQADWFNANKDLLRMVVDAMAFVVPSDMIRGTLTAVMWLAPMPFEVVTHSSLELALDWAIARVSKTDGAIANELLMGGVDAIERHRIRAESEYASYAQGASPRLARSGAR